MASLCVFGPDLLNDSAYTIDVVGKSHAAESFYEDETDSFFIVLCHDVSKADGQHDRVGPVVGPTVLLEPMCLFYVFSGHPVVTGAEVGHPGEQDRYYMSKAKVK